MKVFTDVSYTVRLISNLLFYSIGWIVGIMVNGRIPSVFSKTYVTPRRPYEKARLDQELKIIGEYGLRNKREVWRVKYALAKIRKAARELLTLEEKDEKRLFQGKLADDAPVQLLPKSWWFVFKILLTPLGRIHIDVN